MGGWRDRYRALGDGDRRSRGIGKNGQPFTFHARRRRSTPAASCPTAARSATSASSSGCCSRTSEQIARNLARQLVVYATGAPVRFGDRADDRSDPRPDRAPSGTVSRS